MQEKTTAAILKEQFTILAMLVILIGTVYTDAYYSGFGLRYQSLGLPASHIIYRGFTVLFDAPYVCLPYIVAVIWLASDRGGTSTWMARNRLWISYSLLALVLVTSYLLAVVAGQNLAMRDLGLKSKLPKIIRLLPEAANNPCASNNCRLLLFDSEYIYLFVPQESPDIPHIKRLDRKLFNEIDTSAE
jgi:hypothetical protein